MNDVYKDFFKKKAESKKSIPKPTSPQSSPIKRRVLRKRSRFPYGAVAIMALVSGLLGWWSIDQDLPGRLMKHIDIDMMGLAGAESSTSSAEKSTSAGKEKAEKSTEKHATEVGEKKAGEEAVPEDTSHFEKLRERKAQLDLRENELNELEEELQKQKVEIESRIRQLEELRGQIATILKERIEVDQEKVNKLVETYSNMKPKQAAEILAGVDEDLAVEVLGKMKKKNAAEIMNLLQADKARTLSEKFAGYKTR